MTKHRHGLRMLVTIAVGAMLFPGIAAGAEHPFILWTRKDAAALRRKVETEAWAKAAYERMVKNPDPDERNLANLFRYVVMGDKEAGEQEKKELMRMVRSPIPRGAAQYINVVRYDQLYDLLTPDERREVERCFRVYIENHVFKRAVLDPSIFNDSRRYSRYDARKYTRSNWLPNIIWPGKVSANLMAMALRDEALIRRVWAAYGSWQWWFDEYLCDIGFYSEEFSKMGSTPGAMFLYCRGLERLGLNELGYGYRGKGGATMRGHIESIIHLGYPRVELGTDRPHYPMLTIGDLRQSGSSQSHNLPGYAFQHSIVMGYLADGRGGNDRWIRHGAWGGTRRGNSPQWDRDKTPKAQILIWFEIAHQRWPDAGFDYFLAQMRARGEDRYCPSLFFGLDPIDPARVKAPPAPSAVWPERGLVMLRADESPAYWESAAPAVGMRLATNYAHRVNDCFALTGLYAFNRPIYLNRQSARGYAHGWSRSIQSHCGVTVDGREPSFSSETTTRHAFDGNVKFVAARSKKVYPDVDLTRALLLTREYLLDVFALASPRPRSYHWLVHALGVANPRASGDWKHVERIDNLSRDFKRVQKLAVGDKPWAVSVTQDCPVENPRATALGSAWYERRIGVRMRMLGAPGTTAYMANTPLTQPEPRRPPPGPDEIGGVSIVAARKCPRTAFVALHEPFKATSPRIAQFRRIGQNEQGLGVTVVGKPASGVNDRAMLRLGEGHDRPLTLAGAGESFTFADFAYVRIGPDRVDVSGGLRAMKVRVTGRPKLFVNGKERKATLAGGYLSFGAAP